VKRFLLGLGLAALLAGGATPARAHDAYDDSETHPLRVLAYAVHPIGWLIETAVAKPIHFLVSHPQLEPITGHVPHESPFGNYEPYEPQE
jgi:hypothetical protein